MQTWQVGNFKITKVLELPIQVGLLDGLIPELNSDVVREIDWLSPDYLNESGQILADLHSFVIDDGEHVILTDAGCGNGKSYPMQPIWSNLDTPFLERLAEAGYGREDITIILCTHAHLDHVGWFSMRDEAGKWVPTFPNARLVMVRDEYERHLSQIVDAGGADGATSAEGEEDVDLIARAFHPDTAALSDQTRLIQEESFQPIVDAGHLELVPSNGEVVPGVRYEFTPGHTAAHHSIRLESQGATAFVTGDAFHHPIQIARPDWSSQGDWDGEASARSRRAVLESAAGTDLLFMGTHFAGITAGYIVEDGEGFRLVEKPSVYRRGI
ncbi:MBL fold metallo-hydrolase [Sphaerimonospora sp. CA-214678]|uniref:MBL fold metallo-hydrolase n=1 Tax=Sphaerimonospora sp. CA-214678 TaxID=3240029 RepID=UPI003D8D4BEB